MVTAAPSAAVEEDVLAGIQIIDVDTHFTEPPDLWTKHAPAKFRDRMPQMRQVDGVSRWFVDGVDFSGPGESVVNINDEKGHGLFTLDNFEEMSLAASNGPARLKMMDEMGIHTQVLFSGAAGHGVSKFMQVVQDEELRLQCIKVYNDAVAQLQADADNRLLPQALLPYWDGKAMAEEARRCLEDLKLTGFDILDKPEKLGFPNYDDEYFAPFWEICNDTQAVINLHIGAVASNARAFPWETFGFERSLTIWSIMAYMSNSAAIANFCLSGLFDRYPRLKVVSVESGVAWIPYLLEALEYQWDEMVNKERHTLQRRPSDYYRDNMYGCFWFETKTLKHTLELLGDRNTLFETDFPHPTCYWPNSRERVAEAVKDLPYESRKRIIQDNAAELYKIKL
jgi:predicted TIM-barrel fold metal-dependent hydrolase